MDSRLSMPFSALDSIGTPSTGRSVSDGGHARQVRRPAGPAMITFTPAALAPLAKAYMRSGRAVGGDHLGLVETLRASSASAACRRIGQSDRLPMMMATGALMRAGILGPRKRA
jgi:hypothetical protein